MKTARGVAALALSLTCTLLAHAGTLRCPPDSVKVGNVCIDLYEASVWQIAPSNTKLVKLVQAGKATLADLTAGGATQLVLPSSCSPGFPANFPGDGQWTPVTGSNPPSPGVYAVSIPGVLPSACIAWFQAAQACRLSGKRLLTNLEWQDAAAGTPDPGNTPGANDCNTNSGGASDTGSRTNCKSSWGIFDMIGNVSEWVADWVAQTTACPGWGGFSDDVMCLSGASTTENSPGVLVRGGGWDSTTTAGVFAVSGGIGPSISGGRVGFRCAR
jgi:formylglycine-generating enzyme required for sulfatase activity